MGGYYLYPYVDVLVASRDALCAGDRDFIFTIDGAGVPAWTYPDTADRSSLADRNFPDGGSSTRDIAVISEELAEESSYSERVVDILLQQMGRTYHQDTCTFDRCYYYNEENIQQAKLNAPSCCLA